jgi:hypothetical protein
MIHIYFDSKDDLDKSTIYFCCGDSKRNGILKFVSQCTPASIIGGISNIDNPINRSYRFYNPLKRVYCEFNQINFREALDAGRIISLKDFLQENFPHHFEVSE